jgi:T5SS/PEP-CTERM-associated repeat protein
VIAIIAILIGLLLPPVQSMPGFDIMGVAPNVAGVNSAAAPFAASLTRWTAIVEGAADCAIEESENPMTSRIHFVRPRLQSNCIACWLTSVVLIFSVANDSHAADKFWGAILGGEFNNPNNWQGGSVAGEGDIAHFGLTTNPIFQRIYTVDFTAGATNQALVIEDDFVTFDLNGHIYNTTLTTGSEIGNVAGRAGRLTITDGTWIAVDSQLSIGTVATASGDLTISTGGVLIGSPFLLVVGSLGTGTLTTENNGEVVADEVVIGDNPGITGTATVTGFDSRLATARLTIANRGNGTLNITASGGVESSDGIVGNLAGSSGTVTVSSGGSLTVGNGLIVGQAGRGTLTVAGDGIVSAHSLSLGGDTGSSIMFGDNSGLTANLVATGPANLERTTTIVGPNVNFSAGGNLTLGNTSMLIGNIRHPSLHSPLKSAGTAALDGTFKPTFSGVMPVLGNTWNIIDASAISGNFSLDFSSAPALPAGQGYRLIQADGGTNGKLLQLAVEEVSTPGLIAYDGFDYTAGSTIIAETGGSGWANAWSGSTPSAGVGSRQIQSPGATYAMLQTTGNKAFIAATNQTQRSLLAIQGAGDETVWISFIGQRVGPDTARFFGLSFYEGTTESVNERLTIGEPTDNADDLWGAHFSSSAEGRVAVEGSSVNAESLLLARIDYHSGANDDFYLWVNPDLSLGEPSIGTAGASSAGAFNLAFNIVSMRAGTLRTSDNTHGEAFFDEIRIGSSFADVVPAVAAAAYEGFDYAPAGAAIVGANGGNGFAGPWVDSGPADHAAIAAGSLAFGGLATTGNHVSAVSRDDAIGSIFRQFSDPIGDPGTTRYLSFVVRPDGTLNEGVFNGLFGIDLPGNPTSLFIGKPGGGALDEFVLENFGGTQQHASGVTAVVGEEYLLVLRADFADGNDSFTLYINPEPGLPEPATGTIMNDSDVGLVNGVFLLSTGAFSIDEIRLGSSYADVVPAVPLRGDFNQDGTVDAADYVVWRKGLGATYTQDDYNTWQANFGATLGSGADASRSDHAISPLVPEPATVLLLVFGAAAIYSPARQFRAQFG